MKTRSKDAFIDRIQGAFKTDPMDDPEAAVGAVFALLSERITKGEMADVRHALPKQIRELFPS
jgi:uncharacterized protein (DUF2267 family)